MNGSNKCYKKGPHTRPSLQNLNPVFRKRDKSEDNQILSSYIISSARQTGVLNLSLRGLATIPDKVYDINDADKDAKQSLDMLLAKEEEAWWNQMPLTSLDLSSNQLMEISPKINKLASLTVLLLHDNGLTSIPREIGQLDKLTRVNLSRNRLSELPDEFFTLPDLRYLNVANNEFEELPPAISDLHMLEFLDASHNKLVALPCGIGFLVRVTQLLLSHNHIKDLPTDLASMRSLQKLDLTHNDLVSLPEDMGGLRKLLCLYLQHNDIKNLPNFDGCNDLQELYVSNNFIECLPENFYSQLPHLKILDLRDNKITEISKDIYLLQNLTRLDLTNNSISNLPSSLGNLGHLVSLQIEGNPIKSIRRDILQCGTSRLLKILRDRAVTDNSATMGLDGLNSPRNIGLLDPNSIYPDKFSMRKSRCLSVTMQNLSEVPENVFEDAREGKVSLVDFSKNQLKTLPKGLIELKDCVQDIVFSNNLIKEVDPFIGQLSCVSEINFMCNHLKDLPNELGSLRSLRQLNISSNRFEELPSCIYELSGLEVLLASNNKIKKIDASENKLGALKHLLTLDLSNNNIESVPPELGTLTSITTLEINGNPFRLPRHQIIEKGTQAIMSYLRDRIPN